MNSLARDLLKDESNHPGYMRVETSLYSLIESIQKRVPDDDDDLVVDILSQVLDKSRIKFSGEMEAHKVKVS